MNFILQNHTKMIEVGRYDSLTELFNKMLELNLIYCLNLKKRCSKESDYLPNMGYVNPANMREVFYYETKE